MRSDGQNNRKMGIEIILTSCLVIFIFAAVLVFKRDTNERIVRQNENYVQTITVQEATQIGDVLNMSQNDIRTMAYLYGEALRSPDADMRKLKEMQERSSFDYIEFTDSSGKNTYAEAAPAEKTSDVLNRQYYIEGMKGNTGYELVFHSGITDETLMIFYAPVYYKGEIIGVLNGHYNEEGIKQILSTKIFDTQAKAYLCMKDGTVIISSGDENAPENMLVMFPDTMRVSENVYEEIKKAFGEQASYIYQYAGSQGTGNAYLTAIPGNEFMLIQTFPSAVTNNMINNANDAGLRLEISLIAAFGIYIVCMLWLKWKQKKKLVSEKQEMSRIVDGLIELYQRFIVVDLEKGTYKYLKNMEKGLPAEGSYPELAAYLTRQCIKEEDEEDLSHVIKKDYIQEHLGKDVPYLQCEYRIQNETQKWENMSILCLQREKGTASVVLLAIQDVTTLKETEIRNRIALEEALKVADEASRAKSSFLSRMSHDIRTPMNAIMGMTAVAVMHIEDRERLMDCLNKITLSSRHLLALINDVLDMSKIESGRVSLSEEEFDMSKALESLLAIIHPQIKAKKQELKINISNIAHEAVIGDSMRLQQVFVNIMSNAVKFTPEGGTISLSICEKPSHIHGRGCYEFIFEDTGIGMEPEFIEKLYEPFTRSENSIKNNIEGTGLGMPIVRNIVRMMNGDIQVESRVGEGTKFTVRVYLKLQEVEEENMENLAELRVLVADDEQDACENACEILNSIGMRADGVLSGDEAVRKLLEAREQNEEYAVVILDWKMPGKCGVETTREIRSLFGYDVPVIIFSAYDWSEIEQTARDAGVNAFIAKPLFRSRLLYALKSVLGHQNDGKNVDVGEFEQADYSGKRVLVVEDNEINIEIAEEMLTHIGIEVERACDGQQAVDILLQRPEHYFDMVFMDIQMPVKNGYEATSEIRAADREDLKTIPIVAMSADAFSDDIQRAAAAGMNDHVAKPIELQKLLEALEKWIG